jgi:hypothetical protein
MKNTNSVYLVLEKLDIVLKTDSFNDNFTTRFLDSIINILQSFLVLLKSVDANDNLIIIIEDFIKRLLNIKLNSDINFNSFSDLYNLLYDIRNFIYDFYITKQTTNESVITDSLSNNINYFFANLYNLESKDSGTLDFF